MSQAFGISQKGRQSARITGTSRNRSSCDPWGSAKDAVRRSYITRLTGQRAAWDLRLWAETPLRLIVGVRRCGRPPIGVMVVVDSALGLAGLRQLWSPGTRKPIGDPAGGPLPGSVSEKIWVDINGVKQGMVVRGENERNPVLLWVHGGPGMPDYLLTEQYPTNLEDLFTVVWWDQRGTALSYDANIPPETMTIEQIISDTLAVTDYLRQRFNQEKIYLLGHSWGSLIAIQAACPITGALPRLPGDGADGAPVEVGEDRLRLHAR